MERGDAKLPNRVSQLPESSLHINMLGSYRMGPRCTRNTSYTVNTLSWSLVRYYFEYFKTIIINGLACFVDQISHHLHEEKNDAIILFQSLILTSLNF